MNVFNETNPYSNLITHQSDSDGIDNQSYSSRIGLPFKQIATRNFNDDLDPFRKENKRLTDAEVQYLQQNPSVFEPKLGERLEEKNKTENKERKRFYKKQKFYNKSLKTIGYDLTETIWAIMDDLFNYTPAFSINGVTDFIDIFIKEDRMVYIGIIILFFSIHFVYKTE